ncbi:MAG TPA: PKD domain-containing protein, partial [Bacteroidia bacterium]|nr:PKD domain-containing protein [Bacteroidia bacterium]
NTIVESQTQWLTLLGSGRKSGKWEKPEPLSFCVDGTNFTHPAFSGNDSVLIFSSDKSGGQGGMDLYYSKLSASGWSAPVNLGSRINSPANELFPFVSASGNLYFSSNRPGGNGKLDIYVVHLSDTAHTFPFSLGNEINSADDDFGLWCDAAEREGFFSSGRNAQPPNDNVFCFKISWPQVSTLDTLLQPALCYTFFEEASLAAADTVAMDYEWVFSDQTIKEGLIVEKCFSAPGTFTIDLKVSDRSSGELVESDVHYELVIPAAIPIEFQIDEEATVHEPLVITTEKLTVPGFAILDVYYDFGEGFYARGRSATHVYHKPGIYYPKIILRLKDDAAGTIENRCFVKEIIVK